MSTDTQSNVGTTPVRAGQGFDEQAMARWMKSNVAGFTGPLSVDQFKGGQSNPTYRLMTPAGLMFCAVSLWGSYWPGRMRSNARRRY